MYDYDHRLREAGRVRIEERDKPLLLAYADAWPTNTLFSPYLRYDIAEAFRKFRPHSGYPGGSPGTQKELKAYWSGVAQEVRTLKFHDSVWRKLEDCQVFHDIVPRYNGWSSKKVLAWLAKYPFDRVNLSRDYSPELLVKGPPAILDAMQATAKGEAKADEAALLPNGLLRLWWD